jgi:hypothetical protein
MRQLGLRLKSLDDYVISNVASSIATRYIAFSQMMISIRWRLSSMNNLRIEKPAYLPPLITSADNNGGSAKGVFLTLFSLAY